MRRVLLSGLALFALGGVFSPTVLAGTTAASAPLPLHYDYYPTGPVYNLVDRYFRAAPEFKDYVSKLDMIPDVKMALHDLNGDGVPEIFVHHKDYVMSDICEYGTDVCLVQIFLRTKGSLVEIGRMKSGPVQDILPTKTSNIPDLQMTNKDGKKVVYVWKGRKYEAK